MDMLPPDVRQELVMSAAALDGHSVTTHRFRAAGPPEPLLASMRARWRDEGLRFVESRQGDWTILSTRDAAGLFTIQLRPTSAGVEGLSSRWRRAAPPPSAMLPGEPLVWPEPPVIAWLPAGARVVRHVTHRDPQRDAATVVALIESGPEAAAEGIARGAARAGFEADPALGLPAQGAAWYRGSGGTSGAALAFRRGGEEVVATVSAHREGAALVLHWSAAR
jgi:hypothetical protein